MESLYNMFCFGDSSELSDFNGSNEYIQHMLQWITKKTSNLYINLYISVKWISRFHLNEIMIEENFNLEY